MKFIYISVAIVIASLAAHGAVTPNISPKDIFTMNFNALVSMATAGHDSVSSPLSAELLLALVSLGAEGEARVTIGKALGIPDDAATKQVFGRALSRLSDAKGVVLEIASRVYTGVGTAPPDADFLARARDVLGADAGTVDFRNPENAARDINNWVSDRTGGKIKELVSPDSFDVFTRAVLLNAVHFKGKWEHSFQTAQMHPFYRSDGSSVRVPLMSVVAEFKYGVNAKLNAEFVELPYEGKDASMVLILPQNRNGSIADLQRKFSSSPLLFEVIKQASHPQEMELYVPKFRIETEIDLKHIFSTLGVSQIFQPVGSGLTRLLSGETDLFVSAALQKAVLEVTEEGAEAAAASGAVVSTKATLAKVLRVDRPFLFVITVNREIVFTGTYMGNINWTPFTLNITRAGTIGYSLMQWNLDNSNFKENAEKILFKKDHTLEEDFSSILGFKECMIVTSTFLPYT